jgi:hypothetical protein
MATIAQPVDVSPAKPSRSFLRLIFSFPAMMGALIVGGVFVPVHFFNVDPDLWWHIKVGETILRTHRWPVAEPYSFTAPDSPWLVYEWLGEVMLAVPARLGGLRGLLAFDLVLGAAVVLALYAYASLRCRNSKAGFVTAAILLPLACLSYTLRPQMLGYLFLVLTLIALERFRQGKPGTLWFLPLIFLVWVNTHGSFIIGLGAVGVYWASGLIDFRIGNLEARRWTPAERQRLELVFLLSLIALVITPYGSQLAVYPFDMALNQPLNVANIKEWQSMIFDDFFGKIFLALVLGLLLAQVAFQLTWRVEELVLFLFGTAMACMHVRFILIFVPFFTPLLAVIMARWVPSYERDKDKYALNAVIMVAVVGAVLWFFPSRAKLEEKVAEMFPVHAVEYLREHPAPVPMFNTYAYGGYLIWQMEGRYKVFIDGRADIYERTGVLADYLTIAQLKPPALSLLHAYSVQSCLVDRDEALATLLAASPEWQRVYQDRVSALFVRSALAHHAP